MLAEVQRGVDEVNKQFAKSSRSRGSRCSARSGCPDSDVLTPTSKLKRRGIHARYAGEIEAMYA